MTTRATAQHLAASDQSKYWAGGRRAAARAALVGVALTAGLVTATISVGDLVFCGARIDEGDARTIIDSQLLLSAMLTPYLVSVVLARYMQVDRNYRSVTVATALALVINVAGNAILSGQFGVPGIAAATVAAWIVAAGYLLVQRRPTSEG